MARLRARAAARRAATRAFVALASVSRLKLRAIVGGSDGDDSIAWCCEPSRPSRSKGNNGWGNGAEGINAGSFSGGTAGSKSDESWTIGDGPKPRKFDFR